MSSNCNSNSDKKNINKVKDKMESTDPKALNDGDILRTKRIYTPSSTSETYLSENKAKKIETEKDTSGRMEPNLNKDEKKKEEETKADINNKNSSQPSQDSNNSFLVSFRKTFNELKELLTREFKQENSREFYLISKNWFRKLNDFLKNNTNNNQNIKELLGKIKNDEILDKQVMAKALFLNDEDKKEIKILKPKYYLCNYIKPLFLTKKMWDFLYKIFGGGPEIKILSEPRMGDSGNIIYKRDMFKYIRVNCIVLPMKKNNSNIKPISTHDVSRSNCSYKKKLMNDIQTFYFFVPKNINISDLISHTKNIIKKYTYIKVNDINNIRCWIDLNYDIFEKLLERIEEKICFIYNMFDINPSSPFNLDKQEKEDEKIYSKFFLSDSNIFEFGFRLYPLSTFSHEILINIFPNQFTNNFEELNKFQIDDLNQKIKNLGIGMFDLSKMPIVNIYPELNIIIEQGVNTIFYKAPKIKYKLCEPCGYMSCTNRGLFTIFCKCGDKVYCSYKCKNEDRDYHEEECQYLLFDYFIDSVSENIDNQIMESSSIGIKGIRNIGNTCYMNTAIQCLSNCAELRNYFLFGNPHKDINKDNILGYKGLMAYAFEYIIRKLWLGDELVIDIDKFKKAVGNCNDRFRGMSQQDTHEFVTFLIDSLHEDLNRVKEKKYIEKEERELPDEVKSKIEWNNFLRRNQSILVDLFYGQFKSTVTCSECKKSCIDFNTFSSLSVNLKNISKKANSEEISNKIEKLNINSRESSGIKTTNKTNIDEDKENKSTNQKNENSSEKIIFNRNENFSINSSPLKKEGVLVGGKPNDLEATSTNNEQEEDSDIIIPLVFFFYSTEEKPISFTLPIKNTKELTYKVLLLKISKIFNKDPYSLYLYHISSGDKNIISIYGNNSFSVYDHQNKKVLYVSEINSSIIEKNAISNSILYSSRLPMFTKTKYLSRQIIEKDLNDNKENIIKYVNNIIDEKNDCNDIEDKYLYSHFMSLEKVFQFTLKNYIYDEENKSVKCHYFPKIVVFSKEQTFYSLYCEIIKMNKIILDNESKDNPTELINVLFKYLLETPKEKVNKEQVFNDDNNLPFYICVQKYNAKSTENNNEEVLLLLNEQEKNKKLIDILGDVKDQNDIVNSQILLKIIWNPKYNTKIKNLIKPEKIDGFFNTLIGLNEKKNDINKFLNNSTNKKPTDEEVLLAAKNHYTQLYEKHLNNNNNGNNNNNSDINTGNIYNTISSLNEEDKNVKSENTDNTENTLNTLNSTNNSNKKESKDNASQINSEISLDDSLDILREEELLDENNEWFCENCKKKQRAIKKIEIYNAPKILIIQIKRFSQRDKINTKVNFPLTDLDISNYILSKEKDKKIKYDLFAVANHYGSLYFGHYTAFCKNSITNKWFEFNDSSVNEIDDESRIISHNAYVLFYKQKDLSKLDWKQIYNKQFINIDIKDNNTLVDFNYDFKKNMNSNVNGTNAMQDSDKNNSNVNNNDNDNDNDMNEFDKKMKEIYLKIKAMKSKEMTIEKEETKENTDLDNENKAVMEERKENDNDKNENMLLGKKRSSSEIN